LDTDFASLIARVRAGDAAAAEEIVRSFESAVRVAVRTRLLDPALRREFDSMDICQSVLASFFVRVAAGQYDLQHPAQLVALLTKMAHNKLAWHARHSSQQRRDIRRKVQSNDLAVGIASSAAGPVRTALARELLDQVWQQMDGELRQMATHRLNGMEWDDIGAALGGSGEARRKQYQRGLDRITRLLGVDDDGGSPSQ
jgi:RNA polymerase sigma-70 factor (ECF subfamily)